MASKTTPIIVFGNEKGGTGKSTLAMHVVIRLLDRGQSVGLIDLDSRQKTISRFLDNRARFVHSSGCFLPSPEYLIVNASQRTNIKDQQIEEQANLEAALGGKTRPPSTISPEPCLTYKGTSLLQA